MLRWYSEKTIRSTLHGYHSNLGKLNNSDPLQKQKLMQSSCKIPTCSTWSKSRMELVRKKSSEKRSRVQSQIQPIHPGPQDVWDQYSKLLLASYQGPRTTFSSGINLPRTAANQRIREIPAIKIIAWLLWRNSNHKLRSEIIHINSPCRRVVCHRNL